MLAEFLSSFNQKAPQPERDPTPGLKPRPSHRPAGIYRFERIAFDDEVTVTYPDGNSYLLNVFEVEPLLLRSLKLTEDQAIRLLSMLMNSYKVDLDLPKGHFWVVRPQQEELTLDYKDGKEGT
jgi:hypothetical protein